MGGGNGPEQAAGGRGEGSHRKHIHNLTPDQTLHSNPAPIVMQTRKNTEIFIANPRLPTCWLWADPYVFSE